MMKILSLLVALLVLPLLAQAASPTLSWDPNPAEQAVTAYSVQMSTDLGKSWGAEIPAGPATTITLTNVPDTGLVLFRVNAVNAQGKVPRTDAGAWYCGDWRVPTPASGTGLK